MGQRNGKAGDHGEALRVQGAVQAALAAIGTTGDTQCPKTSSNTEPLLHRLLVARLGQRHFEGIVKNTIEQLKGALPQKSLDAIAELTDRARGGTGGTIEAMAGTHYALNVEVKRPATRLDTSALKAALIRTGRLSMEDLDRIFEEATRMNAPAISFNVSTKS